MRDAQLILRRILRIAPACAALVVAVAAGPAADGRPGPQKMPTFMALSRDHRTIEAEHVGSWSGRPLLVVGVIHGNEPAGAAIAGDLLADRPAPGANIWVVPVLNPDGVARTTRQNADGVDLNRNFPYRWQAAGRPGDWTYPGPRALSEPESRFAFSLINRLRPAITIWFHQPLGLVDESGGNVGVERAYARLVGLPLIRLQRYPGSAPTWQNHRFPDATAFVTELHPGTLSDSQVERYSDAAIALAGQ